MTTKRLGGMRASAMKRNLQVLEGEGDIGQVSGEENGHLPILEDPGGVPQHRRGGYQPRASARPVPRTPRKGEQHDVDDGGEEGVAVIHAQSLALSDGQVTINNGAHHVHGHHQSTRADINDT